MGRAALNVGGVCLAGDAFRVAVDHDRALVLGHRRARGEVTLADNEPDTELLEHDAAVVSECIVEGSDVPVLTIQRHREDGAVGSGLSGAVVRSATILKRGWIDPCM